MSTLGLSLRTRQTIAWILFLGFICLALLATKKPKAVKPEPPNKGPIVQIFTERNTDDVATATRGYRQH